MDTFVVRLWSSGAPDEEAATDSGLHGTAQHVGSGRSAPFRNGLQLLALMAELRRTGERTSTSTSTDTTTQTRREHSA
jgi:hypothetical protein